MKILQIFPTAFAEVMCERFSARERKNCVIKDRKVSILIHMYKKIV